MIGLPNNLSKAKKSMNLVLPEDSRLYRREMNGARKVSVFC